MQQPMVKRGLGLGLLVLLMAMAGCEDPPLPTSVPVANASASASPSPGASASPSGSPRPSSAPGSAPGASPFSPAPGQSAQPSTAPSGSTTASSSPTTGGSSAPTGSPSPSIADPPTAVAFELPAPNADFTSSSLSVRVRVEVPTNVTLQKISVQYDGRPVYEQKGSATTLTFQWNPNTLPLPDGSTELSNAGAHKLTAIATTIAGIQKQGYLEFDKPYLFKGWSSEYAPGKSFPRLPQVRGDVKLVSDEADNQLFALYGIGSDGTDMVGISMLSINNLGQPSVGQWMGMSSGGLKGRRDAAVTAQNEHIYILGGSFVTPAPTPMPTPTPSVDPSASPTPTPSPVPTPSPLYAPISSAVVYNVKQEAIEQTLPDLPTPMTDAQAAVLNGYLYVYGGTSSQTDFGSTTNQFVRLKLTDGGLKAADTWETLTGPDDAKRRGGALVATGGKLYLIGGKDQNGVLRREVYAYTPPTDTAAGTWADVVTLNYGVYQAAIAGLGGKIYVAGGYLDNTYGGPRASTVVEIDPALRTFRTLPSTSQLPSARAATGAAVINGQLFVVGGFEGSKNDQGWLIEKPLDEVIRSIAY